MARLWDKGLPLDERILRFTAGEDHKLDERLVAYDARASIAHARMLEKQQLLSAAGLPSDLRGPRSARRRARGRRVVDRARRRGRAQRARAPAHGAHRRGRRPRASRPLAQRPGPRRAAALSARRDRRARERRRMASSRRSSASRRSKATSPCPAIRTCSRPCRARSRSGRAASAPSSPTIARRCTRVLQPHGAEPARLGRRLRRAELAARPRSDARRARLRAHAGARHRRPALARQGRGRARVRDRRVARRLGPARVRPAALLYERVRLRVAAGRDDDGLVDHAAEAQPRRLRARARRAGDGRSVRCRRFSGSRRS